MTESWKKVVAEYCDNVTDRWLTLLEYIHDKGLIDDFLDWVEKKSNYTRIEAEK